MTEAKFSAENLEKPLVQVVSQPTLRTEKDIGSENPETTTVSGFFLAIFQGGIQKISFPKTTFWGGLELNSTDIKGRFYD